MSVVKIEPSGGWQRGWILDPCRDAIWFLGLPLVAVAVAMGCHAWLPFVALASVNLWITIPHHFATWARTYGLREDWQRWKERLLVGPVMIGIVAWAGHSWAPTTILLLVTMWDHQHSIMQQHGFARIYDFKARAGAEITGRFDLVLGWILYGNMFLTAPLFVQYWVRELFKWQLPVSLATVQAVQMGSWVVTALAVSIYVAHVTWCLRNGHAVNPVKLLFLGTSFFLWYFTAWQTNSILIFGIAHRLMHGLQYIVVVRMYLSRKTGSEQTDGISGRGMASGSLWKFVGLSLLYALVFQLLVGQPQPLETFGFGEVRFDVLYESIPELGLGEFTSRETYGLFATAMVDVVAMVHYYFDSFIWKVSDHRVQEGL